MAYQSTSKYLRQIMGFEKASKKSDPASARSTLRTPTYKTQEEYYDEVLHLRKQIGTLNQENSTIKTKLRRLEQDNQRKEKEINDLLNPGKHEDLHRTLRDQNPNSSTAIHSLKQKILKLETQLKDKENAFSKLQSDLKTTKIEELKVQMETFYQEIVRLQNCNGQLHTKGSAKLKYGPNKVKTLSETILHLNENVQQLQIENHSLKKDLEQALDKIELNKNEEMDFFDEDYEDMTRKELLNVISELQKKLNIFEQQKHQDDEIWENFKKSTAHISGKLVLHGTLAERLKLLDERETELLEELEKYKQNG